MAEGIRTYSYPNLPNTINPSPLLSPSQIFYKSGAGVWTKLTYGTYDMNL